MQARLRGGVHGRDEDERCGDCLNKVVYMVHLHIRRFDGTDCIAW